MHDPSPHKLEGAGNAGCPSHPQPRVRKIKSTRASHHRFTGFTQHSLRNGFNGFLRALLGDRACLPPSSAKVAPRQLDASVGTSGPHDFAVRRSAPSSEAPPASTASRPAFVTIASRPSKGTGPNRYNAVSTWSSREISENQKLTVQFVIPGWSEGLNAERNLFHSTFALEDRSEGMAAFIEKRTPVNKNR